MGMSAWGVHLVRQGLLLQEDWLALVGVAPPRAGYLLLPPCMLLSRLCDSRRRRPHGGQEEEEKVESPKRFRLGFFLVLRRIRCASCRLLRLQVCAVSRRRSGMVAVRRVSDRAPKMMSLSLEWH